MNLNLTNKKALVCGSSQGLGFAAADELADLGCTVVLFARNAEKLEEARLKLSTDAGQQHEILVADFTNSKEVENVIANYLQTSTGFDILINNTGGPAAGPILNATTPEFLRAFECHLSCNHILATALLPHMQKMKWGRIINIISTSVKSPLPNLGVSNTIRGAVASWAKTLASEVGPYGITVNNVLPGLTNTSRAEAIINDKAKSQVKTKHEVLAGMVKEIPLGRMAKPEEVGAVIAFLATNAASYITGVSVPVDGGRLSCL